MLINSSQQICESRLFRPTLLTSNWNDLSNTGWSIMMRRQMKAASIPSSSSQGHQLPVLLSLWTFPRFSARFHYGSISCVVINVLILAQLWLIEDHRTPDFIKASSKSATHRKRLKCATHSAILAISAPETVSFESRPMGDLESKSRLLRQLLLYLIRALFARRRGRLTFEPTFSAMNFLLSNFLRN